MRPNRFASTREALAYGTRLLTEAGVPSPQVDARLLAAHALRVAPLEVLFAELDAAAAEAYTAAITRRAAREPLQHIVGTAAFGPLELEVGQGVFIPRPETEVLGEWAVGALAGVAKQKPIALDLGTGTGALAITLATRCPHARVIAVEKSAVARDYAARNAATCGVGVEIVAGDMTDPGLLAELRGHVDVVVANPPYVPETPDLDPEVYRDPHDAVFSGADGMEAIRGLVPVAAGLLVPGGAIGIEHDETTSAAVARVLGKDGRFERITPLADLAGRPRFVTASKVTAKQPTEDIWPAPSTTA